MSQLATSGDDLKIWDSVDYQPVHPVLLSLPPWLKHQLLHHLKLLELGHKLRGKHCQGQGQDRLELQQEQQVHLPGAHHTGDSGPHCTAIP